LYVYSPDRLSRKYAYQVLLVDEWQRAGIEIVFLNHEWGASPMPSVARFGRLAYPLLGEVTNRDMRGRRSHSYPERREP
jgi:site-specific DNA recombinase